MAALDVLQVATSAASSTTNTVNFSAISAGNLLVFVVAHSNGGVTITPPAGLTSFTSPLLLHQQAAPLFLASTPASSFNTRDNTWLFI